MQAFKYVHIRSKNMIHEKKKFDWLLQKNPSLDSTQSQSKPVHSLTYSTGPFYSRPFSYT
jgi:hypothetical protein